MGHPLVAFALVAEEYERSGDPILGLKPLFSPLLADKTGQSFSPSDFAKDFTATYGLQMSPFVAAALRDRLVSIGLLSYLRDHGVDKFTVLSQSEGVAEFDETRIDETVVVFVRWASKECERLGRPVKEETLEEALLSRLARPGFASIFLVEQPGDRTSRLRALLGRGGVDPGVANEEFLDYLVAQFVLASESAPEVFEAIASIAYGSLIADAVAGLAVPGQVGPAKPLRVVLDGPLLMDLLDLNTEAHREYAEDLVQMLNQAGLMLATFDHLIEEMHCSITATLGAGADSHGPLADRIRANPQHRLYATNVADTLESRVKALGVTVLRGDLYEEARYKRHFSEEQEDRVRNAIGDMHHQLDRRIRDARSVALVARLKGENRSPGSVLDAGTIFVTRNSALCDRVNRALSVGRSEPMPRFTIATDGQLAGILWFVLGSSHAFLMSRRRLIANCAAAVLPRREVISRVSSMLTNIDEKLGQEFEALMRDSRASLCPMRLTAGIPEVVDESLSLAILQEMKQQLAAPVVEEALRERKAAADEVARVEGELRQSREAVVVLQAVVGRGEEDKARFDSQLAQMHLDLEKMQAREEAVKRAADDDRMRFDQRRQVARDLYEGRVEKSLRRLRIEAYGLMGLLTIATWFTDSTTAKVGSGIVSLLCMPFVNPWFDNLLKRGAQALHSSDEEIVRAIEDRPS